MEEIIIKYIENKHNEIIDNNKKLLELKDKETNNILELKDVENNKLLQLKNQEIKNKEKLLELKDKEIENKDKLLVETTNYLQIKDNEINNLKNQTYEEIEKDKHIYIFSTDKPNIFKCGRTKDINKRKAGLQTGNVDNIITLEDYHTSDDLLLEKIVHNILDNYRCKSHREHFFCNWKYIQLIIRVAGCFLDTLKSTYEYITEEELLEKINNKLSDITLKNNSSNDKPIELLNLIVNNIESPNLIVNNIKPINPTPNEIIIIGNNIKTNLNEIITIRDEIITIQNKIITFRNEIIPIPIRNKISTNPNKIINKLKCNFCNKIFATRQSKSEHKRKSCKMKLLIN